MVGARAVVGVAIALGFATVADAHHPGSHATKQSDGRIRLEVVATVTDTCTQIAEVGIGAPVGVSAASGSVSVTVHLRRPDGVCASAVAVVRAERVLDLGQEAAPIHLYVLAPDGSVASTERVPIR